MSRVPVAGETVSRLAPAASFLFRVKSVEQFANDIREADTCVDAECHGVFVDESADARDTGAAETKSPDNANEIGFRNWTNCTIMCSCGAAVKYGWYHAMADGCNRALLPATDGFRWSDSRDS